MCALKNNLFFDSEWLWENKMEHVAPFMVVNGNLVKTIKCGFKKMVGGNEASGFHTYKTFQKLSATLFHRVIIRHLVCSRKHLYCPFFLFLSTSTKGCNWTRKPLKRKTCKRKDHLVSKISIFQHQKQN